MKPHRMTGLVGVMLLWAPLSFAATPAADLPAAKQEAEKLAQLPPEAPRGPIDHSGRKQKGRASFYAKQFNNRKMANGQKFNPRANVAASKTLPLGTTRCVASKIDDPGRRRRRSRFSTRAASSSSLRLE